jgi:hypothetical protein
LNKTSGQTLQVKTQNPLYYGTEGVVDKKEREKEYERKEKEKGGRGTHLFDPSETFGHPKSLYHLPNFLNFFHF